MSDIAVKVENLGKKYVIGHQQEGAHRYRALRDVIADGVKSFGRKSSRVKGKSGVPHKEDFWALKDVSFEIKQGEVVGIIGRNGAGKSTLLKILSRITEPTTGKITLKGRVASLLEVGTGFHPELTGRENIFLNGAILGMSRAEINRKFDEIVDFAEISRFLDTPVKRYSSGMYVRLAFAVAAHLEPEILVVDEVLAVGDAAFQKKCLGKMGSVARDGRTILFVSHDMPTIQSLCQRAYLIDMGRLSLEGDTDFIISRYLSGNNNFSKVHEINLENYRRSASRSKEPALKKIWLQTGKQERTSIFKMGEEIQVYVEFCCREEVRNPGIGFGVSDCTGRRIFSLNNYMIPTSSNTYGLLLSGIAKLSIPKLQLIPGSYFLTISLVENQVEWIDCIEKAIEFEVSPADVFGSGKIPDASQGLVFCPGKIFIENGAESIYRNN
jgi:lipopolysaccharide transport system ATP-binding protein